MVTTRKLLIALAILALLLVLSFAGMVAPKLYALSLLRGAAKEIVYHPMENQFLEDFGWKNDSGRIEEIVFKPKTTLDALSQLKHFPEIERVQIQDCDLRGFDFSIFENFKELQSLSIERCQFDVDQQIPFGRLAELRVFSMIECGNNDNLLTGIDESPSLYWINFEREQIDEDVFRKVSRMRSLKWLMLFHSDFPPESLFLLNDSPVELLYLEGTETPGAVIGKLKCSKLSSLLLLGWEPSDSVCDFPPATILDVSKSDLGHLTKITFPEKLRRLKANGCVINSAFVKAFDECPNVSDLALNQAKIENLDQIVDSLIEKESFERLELDGIAITDDMLISILQSHRTVRSLSLNDTQISDASIDALQDCKELKYLNVERTQMSDKGIKDVMQRRKTFSSSHRE